MDLARRVLEAGQEVEPRRPGHEIGHPVDGRLDPVRVGLALVLHLERFSLLLLRLRVVVGGHEVVATALRTDDEGDATEDLDAVVEDLVGLERAPGGLARVTGRAERPRHRAHPERRRGHAARVAGAHRHGGRRHVGHRAQEDLALVGMAW